MSQAQGVTAVPEGPTPPVATKPTTVDATTAGQAAQSNSAAGDSTTISSLADLRRKSPKVYNMLIQSLGEKICYDMQKHNDRLKQQMSA